LNYKYKVGDIFVCNGQIYYIVEINNLLWYSIRFRGLETREEMCYDPARLSRYIKDNTYAHYPVVE
jgi:hypothetical protein